MKLKMAVIFVAFERNFCSKPLRCAVNELDRFINAKANVTKTAAIFSLKPTCGLKTSVALSISFFTFVSYLRTVIPRFPLGVNFINILRTNFSYERRFGSLESGFERTFVQKMRAKNVDEIDSRFRSRKNSNPRLSRSLF
jgi:hypothetical protein